MRVLIAAHYNLNNGDRALLEATIQIVKKLFPDSEITVSAYAPEFLHDERFSVVGWALGNGKSEIIKLKLSHFRFLRSFFRKQFRRLCNRDYLESVKKADIVLMSGGHHLTDILSNQGYYKLASNFYIPIACKKKVVLLPQSIGPAKSDDIKDSIKLILQNAYSVAYRDKSSEEFIRDLNIQSNSKYVPDLVYSLLPSKNFIRNQKTVGIALYHSYVEKKTEKFTIGNLTIVIDWLIKEGYSIKIIPMDEDDEEYAKEIYNNLETNNKENKFTIANRGSHIMDIISEFSTVSFCLAYKTHSTVFSMICETPLVAIAYHPKTIEFMRKVGLESFAINDTEASSDKLKKLITELVSNYDYIQKKELCGVTNNRKEINTYLREILQ